MANDDADHELSKPAIAAFETGEADIQRLDQDLVRRNTTSRKSEKRLEYALEGTSDGLWDWDMRTNEVYYSPRWEEMFGFAPGTAPRILNTFSGRVHPDDLARTFAAVERFLDRVDPVYNIEIRMQKLDGTPMWTQHRGTALFDEDGQGVRMIGTTMDTTARKRAESALQRTSQMLEKTSRMARVGGWELDLTTQRLSWSAMTKQIHEVAPDYEPKLEAGINFYKQGESRDRISQVVQRAIAEGVPYDVELQIVTNKNNTIWVRAIGEPEFIDGTCKRLVGAFQDISERKAREGRRRRGRSRPRPLQRRIGRGRSPRRRRRSAPPRAARKARGRGLGRGPRRGSRYSAARSSDFGARSRWGKRRSKTPSAIRVFSISTGPPAIIQPRVRRMQ